MDAETNTPTQGLDMDAAIAQLMGKEPSEPETRKRTTDGDEVTKSEETLKTEEAAVTSRQKPTVDPDEQAVESLTEDDEEEDTDPDGDEESEDESDEEEDEENSEGAEDEEDEQDEPETVFQLEDGTEVDLDELKRGYLRQSDYTKKTQEVAEGRKQIQQAFQQREQERQVLAENLNLALSVVEPQLAELAGTDWDALAREDAYTYAEKRALFDQAQARYNKLAESAQSVVQQTQAQTRQQMQLKLQQEARKLQMAIPDFADPTRGKALKQELNDYAVQSIGLSENEARGITDHRMIILMKKAMEFDRLSESGLSVAKKKVSKAPKRSLKPGKPTSRADKQTQARKQQQAKLRQSGKIDDAVALLLNG